MISKSWLGLPWRAALSLNIQPHLWLSITEVGAWNDLPPNLISRHTQRATLIKEEQKIKRKSFLCFNFSWPIADVHEEWRYYKWYYSFFSLKFSRGYNAIYQYSFYFFPDEVWKGWNNSLYICANAFCFFFLYYVDKKSESIIFPAVANQHGRFVRHPVENARTKIDSTCCKNHASIESSWPVCWYRINN